MNRSANFKKDTRDVLLRFYGWKPGPGGQGIAG
jgi:hypothetical protein